MVSIQQAHTVAAVGYRQNMFRTGYEYVVGQRSSDMFCYAAKQDGKVISKTADGILVEYKDGTRKGVALGRQYGRAEGSVYPHDVVSHLEPGQSFKKGEVIAYNTGFFEQDFMDPTAVVLKSSMMAKVVLYESAQTFEDSCAISSKLAQRCTMNSTKVKSFTVDFKQNLLNVAKPGQKLTPKDILMIIEDEITAGSDAFDEEALAVLASLSKSAPKAGYLGVLDHIEVFYHGSVDDMSSTLRALVDRSDKKKASQNKAIGKPPITGVVNSDYRVEGVPLALNKAEVRFYITVQTGTGSGDKLVFGNQLKSTIGEVMDYSMRTKDGDEIEGVFGFRSIAARMVTSASSIGTTNTLLKVVAKKAVELYKR